MKFTQSQLDGICEEGNKAFDGDWLMRGLLVRSPAQRLWLCHEIAAAAEQQWYCTKFGARDPATNARREMVRVIRSTVKKRNENCGFVIESIILAAILSWLIQRLLDWMFLNAENP